MTSLRTQARCAERVLRGLVRLLPARSRERYAAELADVYAALLDDAARTGSRVRLWHQAAVLFTDCGQSLAAEYLDLWRASRLNPHVSGVALLLASAVAWLLIVMASAGNQAWAAQLLDVSLGLTMAVAFGFPAVAFGLSRVRLAPYAQPYAHESTRAPNGASIVPRLSCAAGAAALTAWVILALHLGQTAA